MIRLLRTGRASTSLGPIPTPQMPATFTFVREVALGLPGVEEGICHGTPALYVHRKLMARLSEDGETLVLKVAVSDRTQRLEQDPDIYFLTDHYRNYPVMLVNLLAIHRDDLRRAIEGAWRFVAPPKVVAACDLN